MFSCGSFWQFATVVAAINGFFLVTLIITYLLPILSAVVQKRQFATYVTSLGISPEAMLRQHWNGQNFGILDQHMTTLTPTVLGIGQQHLAYPLLHYYHSPTRAAAVAPSLAALDELLTMLLCGVAVGQQPDQSALRSLRNAITLFLETLDSAFIVPTSHYPPPPDLSSLRKSGIRTVDDETYAAALEQLAQRRRLLFALVRHDGWQWDDVVKPEQALAAHFDPFLQDRQ